LDGRRISGTRLERLNRGQRYELRVSLPGHRDHQQELVPREARERIRIRLAGAH
jgi:hypothetical protein